MIETFTKDNFESYLTSNHSPFTSLGLVNGEYAYMLPLDNQTGIIIRSSVKSNGLSADVGKDSIRCWLVSGNKPLGSKISKWTTRQPGWQNRLTKNIKQLAEWRMFAGDCKECGLPKGIFKARTEGNKGRPFARCREHDGFVWLDEPIKTSDIYFSEDSHGKEGIDTQASKIQAKSSRIANAETSGNSEAKESKEEIGSDYDISEGTKSLSHKSQRGGDKHSLQHTDDTSAGDHADGTEESCTSVQGLRKKSPNDQQKQAIEADINADLRVLAGPGSGKTFVIEHRYKFLVDNGVDPDKIIVCTFGKQSATDMGQRIIKTCPTANLEQICTINALCYRLLAKWYTDSRWYNWRGPKEWMIKKTLEDIVGPLWDEKEKPSAQEVYNWISKSKYLGLTTDDSYLWFADTLGQQRGAWLYEIRSKFDAWLNRNKFLTFADQLFLVEQRLKNDSNWRAIVQERFSHVIVDEMQDTSGQAIRILVTISLDPGQNTVYENEVE